MVEKSFSQGEGREKRRHRIPRAARLLVAAAVSLALAGTSAQVAPAATPSLRKSHIAPSLLGKAQNSPDAKVRVIVQAGSTAAAQSAVATQSDLLDGDRIGRRLNIIHGVAAQMKAKRVARLAEVPGLTVTPDAQLKAADFSSDQLWPYESGNAQLWQSLDVANASSMPAIAIVDSGIDASRADVAGRVVTSVNFTTASPNSPGDGRGHGTFVAGVAAGAAPGHAGAAPGAKLVSVDVLNDDGMGWTSDVIAGADWILQHKNEYGIRVANFSLNASADSSFLNDPLDRAVERLWFAGVVVVAAAGNYGDGVEGTVKSAPGNDPFVITVGAADLAGTADPADDFAAPWSAYGFTHDGFRKPEVGASGRYMIAPVSTSATLSSERPDDVVAPGYMQLSGTSFATPVVSGAAAHVLALHPEYTPDQVKGALMITARPTAAAPWSLGVGEINAVFAATVANPTNPNAALEQFLTTDASGATVFDAERWAAVALSDPSWSSASGESASWNNASWNNASWNNASWNNASWNNASWNNASWNNSATELGVDDAVSVAYTLTPEEAAALASDPLLAPLSPLP
jgi:serine protease AprX